jgi:hypothetical protein
VHSVTLAFSPWIPFLQTALGALIEALGATIGDALGSWFNWQKERQNIAAAFAGQIEAPRGIVEYREIRQLTERCIELTTANSELVYLRFSVEDPPFPVFEANVNKIGFLPADLAHAVAEYYMYASQPFQTCGTFRLTNSIIGRSRSASNSCEI